MMAIRVIYYGGAREKNKDGSSRRIGINDNSAFKFAALNIKESYQKFNDTVILKKITTAREIVTFLNSQSNSSIASLDILSHGSPLSLNFSLNSYEACGFYSSWIGKKAIESYYSDDEGDFTFTHQAQSVSDIPWSRFKDSARVQLHGCLTASDWFRSPNGKKLFPTVVDNIVQQMSDELDSAGKKNAIVIGHTTRGNPLINGSATTLLQQDYRHGERKIYNNGDLVLTTKERGYLSNELLQQKIKGWTP